MLQIACGTNPHSDVRFIPTVSSYVGPDGVEFTPRVDEVEWCGSSQFAHLGYEISPAIKAMMGEAEDVLEFDLLQNLLVAQLTAETVLRPGEEMRGAVPRQEIHVFDPVTSENSTLPR